jgi:hypothetical protein
VEQSGSVPLYACLVGERWSRAIPKMRIFSKHPEWAGSKKIHRIHTLSFLPCLPSHSRQLVATTASYHMPCWSPEPSLLTRQSPSPLSPPSRRATVVALAPTFFIATFLLKLVAGASPLWGRSLSLGKTQIVAPPPPLASRVDLAQPPNLRYRNFKFSPISNFTAVVGCHRTILLLQCALA